MKKTGTIVQWCFAGLFLLTALATGSAVSIILGVIAALLMAPIKPIRDGMEKIKVKGIVAVVLSVVLFFVAIGASPVTENIDTTGPPSTTESTSGDFETAPEEKTSSETNDSTEPTKETVTEAPTQATTEDKNSGSGEAVGSGKAEAVTPSKMPAYSGNPYTVVNNNQPNFSVAELTVTAYEKYSPLDSLGRCGVALASCGTDIMPAPGEKRGSISEVKPSGWVQAKYKGVSGGYLWNRCHLLGWQLSAENANNRNLITGTRYMNVEGMLPFENMVADYIRETDNHVAYRVTPIYDGNNLVASGVQLEAYSIEDDGEGICFNVYCYNVQPGINIDYATGKSWQGSGTTDTGSASGSDKTNESKPQKPTEQETQASSSQTSSTYVLNTNSKKFHYPDCSSAKKISSKNRAESNKSRDTLIAEGYSPCGNCDP